MMPAPAAVGVLALAAAGMAAIASPGAAAQQSHALAGHVRTTAGSPAAGVDVFLLETLEGAPTGAAGEFVIHTTRRGATTVVVQGIGYREARVRVDLPREAPLEIVVEVETIALEPIVVRASSYAAGAGEAAELTSIEVVSTPGAHADVLQAVGAFPGVQPVAEGAALYVRGGDVAETKVLLDGAVVLAPYRFESALASFGTFDPFQLEGIAFSSGGFGARHGDALSGLVELETVGRPARAEASVTASLAAVAAQVAVPLPHGLGVRATVNRSSTGLMFRLNGHETEFVQVPESRNAAGGVTWEYRPGGRLKAYAFDEWNRFAVSVEEPAYAGTFSGEDGSRLAVLSFEDVAGEVGVSGSVSLSTRSRRQEFGAFLLDQGDRLVQGRAVVSREAAPGLVLRTGIVADARESTLAGSYPEAGEDPRPGARVTSFESRVEGTRTGVFAEAEWRAADRLELTAGLRSDRSSLPAVRTWDPRLSGAFRVADGAFLTFAWGRYHQVRAPSYYEPTTGLPALPPMAATHRVAGFIAESDERMLRIEVYDKTQRDLAQLDRDYVVHDDGRGRARGFDLFVRGPGALGTENRISYSFIDAERTDPNTGERATSPVEIRHALTLVMERPLGEAWRLGATLRYASGRPYTPVVDAVRNEETGVWRPVYGAPYSARLKSYGRVDLSAQYLHSFGGDDLSVVFVSLTNVLDRVNESGMSYDADYTERDPVESAFRRTLYFGVSTTIPF